MAEIKASIGDKSFANGENAPAKMRDAFECISSMICSGYGKIAKNGPIPEEELVSIIIDNMGDASNTSAMRYSANTIGELKAMLGKYEQIRMLKEPGSSTRVKPQQASTTSPEVTASETRCFNCSAFGHLRDKCPKPPRPPGSCFRCFQTSHLYKDCPERKKSSTAVFAANTDAVTKLQETQEEVQQASLMNHWSLDHV
ncbi:uncharacterized protein LOC128718273 [Anopheles marshallii]|uniref:uncharacterized protein LOC128718273 n=1 Tax=Anopheles marshallii TaxID=1521116 RepID=UPI00237BD0FE|nr:uncharacterized protein LOC128718273 [Anopheles marshallii]